VEEYQARKHAELFDSLEISLQIEEKEVEKYAPSFLLDDMKLALRLSQSQRKGGFENELLDIQEITEAFLSKMWFRKQMSGTVT
jgi:hypothetical protein